MVAERDETDVGLGLRLTLRLECRGSGMLNMRLTLDLRHEMQSIFDLTVTSRQHSCIGVVSDAVAAAAVHGLLKQG